MYSMNHALKRNVLYISPKTCSMTNISVKNVLYDPCTYMKCTLKPFDLYKIYSMIPAPVKNVAYDPCTCKKCT